MSFVKFDRRYRSWLDMSAGAPQMRENFFNVPGAAKSPETDDSNNDQD